MDIEEKKETSDGNKGTVGTIISNLTDASNKIKDQVTDMCKPDCKCELGRDEDKMLIAIKEINASLREIADSFGAVHLEPEIECEGKSMILSKLYNVISWIKKLNLTKGEKV